MAAHRIWEFDTWRANYGGATVKVWLAGTTTLASIYSDEDLSVALANPQTLSSQTTGEVTSGKFAQPVYVGVDYKLNINTTETTGEQRVPLRTLAAADASAATGLATGGSVAHTIASLFARYVYVTDFGVFLPTSDGAASATTNTTTLTAAIAAATGYGGGRVVLPAGTFAVNAYTVPTNVIVQGASRAATVVQCSAGSAVATISGALGGFANITLDGVSKVASSVGVYAKAINDIVFEDVLIKRFVTGLSILGGSRNNWKNLSIDACTNGAFLRGDNDASGGADGAEFWHNRWSGGVVSNCTTVGVELKYVDKKCWHNTLSHIGLTDNTGVALRIIGARYTDLTEKCWFDGNTTDMTVEDGTDPANVADNTVIGLQVDGGTIESNMTFTGTCQDIVFDGVHFSAGTYTLTSVYNAIIALDCIESGTVTLAGTDTTRWMRQRRSIGDSPGPSGVTTDATVTEAWAYDLAPGERVIVEAKVIANGRNVIDYATYHIAQSAHRTGSTLAYDAQTGNFTLGLMATGTTSGATGRITADSDAGATGTLTLREIVGEFDDDEIITDTSTGSATVNGTLSHQNAALLGSITSIQAAVESDANCACIFGVTAGKVRVIVTGVAAKTFEWTVSASVSSG